MKYKEIILRMEDGIATLTLNRPEKKNALSYRICDEICDAVDEVANNDEARVLVLTGAGSAFSAGGDLETHPATTAKDRETRIKHLWHSVQVASKLRSLEIPLIGSINGPALGAGCDIACACDIRIASEKARMGFPEVKLGIFPGWGGTQRITRVLGLGKTKELVFTGEMINAEEAIRIGLVEKVVPPDKLMDEALKMAGAIAKTGPIAVKLAKTAINAGSEMDLQKALLLEKTLVSLCFDSDDRVEGMKAFLEKREPEFTGR